MVSSPKKASAPAGAAWRAKLGVWAPFMVAASLGLLPACKSPAGPSRASVTATSESPPPPIPGSPPLLPTGAIDIPAMVAKLEPVVVNVTVEHYVHLPSRTDFDFESPFDFFFGFPGRRGQQAPGQGGETLQQRAQGTGFIIDAAGHVVTNAHVVEGADTVRVKLFDDRELQATVKGRDRHLDVAVLELKGAKDLPVATLGSSEKLRVGEYVVAIGNPFGLGHTVTLGIVSAKSRAIGAGPYDDFIQTDAAINPGNSGGPLFDLLGEVVGINTAMSAQGSGIGFAIPIDEAKGIVNQLVAKGTVERGRLGVVVQAVDWPLARALGLDRPKGALVAEVESGSPADKAGLQAKDVIVAIDGKKIEHWQELPRLVAGRAPGSHVKVEVVRGKDTRSYDIALGRLPDDQSGTQAPGQKSAPANLGLQIEDAPEGGAVVRRVDPMRPAGSILEPGDVVLEVNGNAVKSAADFTRLLQSVPEKAPLLLKIRRAGQVRYVGIEQG